MGRITRLGQKRISNIWVLTCLYTYDQTTQHRAARKMITIMAGQGSLNPTTAEKAMWRLVHDIPGDESDMDVEAIEQCHCDVRSWSVRDTSYSSSFAKATPYQTMMMMMMMMMMKSSREVRVRVRGGDSVIKLLGGVALDTFDSFMWWYESAVQKERIRSRGWG